MRIVVVKVDAVDFRVQCADSVVGLLYTFVGGFGLSIGGLSSALSGLGRLPRLHGLLIGGLSSALGSAYSLLSAFIDGVDSFGILFCCILGFLNRGLDGLNLLAYILLGCASRQDKYSCQQCDAQN